MWCFISMYATATANTSGTVYLELGGVAASVCVEVIRTAVDGLKGATLREFRCQYPNF